MAIKENSFVYVNISKEGNDVDYKRSRCVKINDDGTCSVKIMMKGNSYNKDENGNHIISKVDINKVEEIKPVASKSKNEDIKSSEIVTETKKKSVKETSKGKIIYEEKEVNDSEYDSKNYWGYCPHDDFLTDEDVEVLGRIAFRMNKRQLEEARINY